MTEISVFEISDKTFLDKIAFVNIWPFAVDLCLASPPGLIIIGNILFLNEVLEAFFYISFILIVKCIYVCMTYYEKFFRRNKFLFIKFLYSFLNCFPSQSGDQFEIKFFLLMYYIN